MNLKLGEGQSIAKHLNDFEGMIAQLLVAGLSLDDETRACLLLGSLMSVKLIYVLSSFHMLF